MRGLEVHWEPPLVKRLLTPHPTTYIVSLEAPSEPIPINQAFLPAFTKTFIWDLPVVLPTTRWFWGWGQRKLSHLPQRFERSCLAALPVPEC